MPYGLIVSVKEGKARKNILPLDQQNLGTFTEEEKKRLREQAEQRRRLEAEEAKRAGKKLEAAQDPLEVAMNQLKEVVSINAKRQYFSLDLLSRQAQELRKAVNRMMGYADDADKFSMEVTSRHIDNLKVNIEGLLKYAGEEDKAEVEALDNELEAVDKEFMDWYNNTIINISASNVLEENGCTTGNYMPDEIGKKFVALRNKVTAYVNRKIEELDRDHPKKDKDRPDDFDVLREGYKAIADYIENTKDSAALYEKYDANPYVRMRASARTVTADVLNGDRLKRDNTKLSADQMHKAELLYELIPIKKYYAKIDELGRLNDEVNALYRQAVKAEADALKDPKFKKHIDELNKDYEAKHEEALKAVGTPDEQEKKRLSDEAYKKLYDAKKEKIQPFIDTYNKKREELLDESAKLDGLYDKIKKNMSLMASNNQIKVWKAITGNTTDLDSLKRTMVEGDLGISSMSVGVMLHKAHENHKQYQEMITNGWSPDQANLIIKIKTYIDKRTDYFRNSGDREDALDDITEKSLNRIADDCQLLGNTHVGTSEGMKERTDVLKDRLFLLMQHLHETGPQGDRWETISEDDIRILMTEFDRTFNHEPGVLENELLAEATGLKAYVKRQDSKYEYSKKQQKEDVDYVHKNFNGFEIEIQLNEEDLKADVDFDNVNPHENINMQGVMKPEEDINTQEVINPEEEINPEEKNNLEEDIDLDDIEQNLNINSVQEKGVDIQPDPEPQIDVPEEVTKLIDGYVARHPFENAALGVKALPQQDALYRYNATQALITDGKIVENEVLFDGMMKAADAGLGTLKKTTGPNGAPLDEYYAEVRSKLLTDPVHEKWDEAHSRNWEKASEEFGEMEGLSDHHKEMLISARAVELTGEEMKKTGNPADRELFETVFMSTQMALGRERTDDGSTLMATYDKLRFEAERKAAEERRRQEEERRRQEEERRRQEEEERLRREAEERARQQKASFESARDAIKDAGEVKEAKPAKKVVKAGDMIPPGNPIRKNSASSRDIEKINSVDINRLTFYMEDIMMRVGDRISDDRKKEMVSKLNDLNFRLVDSLSMQVPSRGSGMAANMDWFPIPAGLEKNVKEMRLITDELRKAMDDYIKGPKHDPKDLREHDPVAVYYSDYLRCLSEGRSYYANVQGDGVYERLLANTIGAMNYDRNQFDFDKTRKSLAEFPLLQAMSKANAMHRMMEDESAGIDEGNGVEMENEQKMLVFAKGLKKDFEAMNEMDDAVYNEKYEKTQLFQQNQRGNLKLGAGRGFEKAYRENNERIQALEHKWLVRDLSLISRMGDLAESMGEKLAEDKRAREMNEGQNSKLIIPEDQKKTMEDFIKYYKETMLKNSVPMTESRRKELLDGAAEVLEKVTYPPVKKGIEIEKEGKGVNNDTMRTGDKGMATMAGTTLSILNKVTERELSLSEKQTMMMSSGTISALVDNLDGKWKGMPKEPFWHKANTAKDPFGKMQLAWDELQAAIKRDGGDHPERSVEVQEAARKLKKASEVYIKAKDVQKKLDKDKLNIRDLRAANKEKRSEFGQYRYDLADNLRTAAGMIMAVGKNERLLAKALPKPEKKAPVRDELNSDLNIADIAAKYNTVTANKKPEKKKAADKASGQKQQQKQQPQGGRTSIR